MSIKSALVGAAIRNPVTRALLKWETYAYPYYKLTGRTFADWYAARMARFAKVDPDGGCGDLRNRDWQIKFATERNIFKPTDDFLDYGCGSGAAGAPFIQALEPGRYVGADITKEFLEIARRRIGEMGLEHKRPEYILLPSGDMTPLGDRQYDVIWSQSVLGHMPEADLRKVISSLAKRLKPSGSYYATAFLTQGSPYHLHHLNFWFPLATFEQIASEAGMNVEIVPGWVHPHAQIDALLKFTHAA